MSTFSASNLAPSAPAAEDTQAGIELRGVSLRFRLFGDRAPSLKQTVLNTLFRRKFKNDTEFWIYRDLDLTIAHGQRLGIIGGNGAGKSTLLKMICGIYNPTVGEIRVRGRIAPLIELGAGFNPELSGIENIFLNGALLGFSRKEMAAKTERIISFAGLQEFQHTPIKYYSTGMLMRLAFAVATDVDPEILIIDEIFAGGDAEFVERATARMNHLMNASHIVVMVSHDLSLIRNFCDRVVWLHKGKIVQDGPPNDVCDAYLNHEHRLASQT